MTVLCIMTGVCIAVLIGLFIWALIAGGRGAEPMTAAATPEHGTIGGIAERCPAPGCSGKIGECKHPSDCWLTN